MKRDVMFHFTTVLLICVLFAGVEFLLYYNKIRDPQLQIETYSCKVLDKMDSESYTHIRGHHYNYRHLTLILQTKGINFSLDVEPVTYSQSNVGDYIYITLPQYKLTNYNCTPLWIVVRTMLLYSIVPVIWLAVVCLYIDSTISDRK